MPMPPWITARVERAREVVTAFDLLSRYGVTLPRGYDSTQQIPCPFHGDKRPSCRVYDSTAGQPSHVWCYVCNERWDVIRLFSKFENIESDKFTRVLTLLEKAFDLPPLPEGAGVKPEKELTPYEKLLPKVELRLSFFRGEVDAAQFMGLVDALDEAIHVGETAGHQEGEVQLQHVLDLLRVLPCAQSRYL